MIKNLYISSTEKKVIKSRVHRLVGSLQKELEFSIDSIFINFVNSEEIQKINQKYLKHDYSTDIITFNYSGSHVNFDGEIFISIADAKISAKKYKTTLNNELCRLVIHGILHLNGFDDIKINERRKMKRIENNLTMKYNFALLR